MTDFKRVLLTDSLSWELFGLAAREKLLYRANDDNERTPIPRLRAVGQRTLSLLVLFDKILVHDFSAGIFRIPDLENDGIVKVVPQGDPHSKIEPLQTRWKLGPLSKRKRPPKSLLRSLRLLKEERSLVIARLLTVKSEWERSLAAALGVSRKQFLHAFFEYAIACVEGDQDTLERTIFNRLPADMLAEFTRSLFNFRRDNELIDELNAKLIFAIVFADEIRIIQELSTKLGVGVATEHYRSKNAIAYSDPDPRSIANRFIVLRTVLAEDRGVLPHIRDIRHALALRQDPNIRSFRQVLLEFHKSIQRGDTNEYVSARREIARAKRALARRQTLEHSLYWVSYFALPMGIAEVITGAPPIGGISLDMIGATGTVLTSKSKRRHGWVLFGM